MLYIPLNYNKEPIIPQVIPQNCVADLDKLENAGILLPKDIVVIDFDGHNTNEKHYVDWLLENYPTLCVTTDRGYHIYYKKAPGVRFTHVSNRLCACGLIVDFVCGKFVTIKRGGIERKRTGDFEFSKLPTLPKCLYPLGNIRDQVSLAGTDEGERNNNLYYHLLHIRRKYGSEDFSEIAQIINNVMFRKPLPEKELKTTYHSAMEANLEGNSTTRGGNNGGSSTFELAKWLIDTFSVRKYKGQLWHKNGIGYVADESLLASELNNIKPITANKWSEILFQLHHCKKIRIPDEHKSHIRVDNGVIYDGKFMDILPSDDFTAFYLPIAYNPNAYDEHVDGFLNFLSANDRDMRNVIEEMFGHIILTEDAPHAFFLITGNGENGKSTFLNMIKAFTKGLHSTVDIKNFSNPNALVRMYNKLVNVADDVDPDFFEDSKPLKVISSGGEMEVKVLFKDTFSITLRSSLIFTANRAPVWKDKTHGIYRRFNIIHLDNIIQETEIDFLEKLTTNNAKQYILRLALEGVDRFFKNNMKVSYCKRAEEAKHQYMTESDPMLYWLDETGEDINDQNLQEVYEMFTLWSQVSGVKQLSKIEFGRRLRNIGYYTESRKENGQSKRKIFKR